MVLVVTQETFDEVVQESMEEFGMSREEAVIEACQQFEAQGVDLSHIVRDPMSTPANSHVVVEAVQKLDAILKARTDKTPEEYLHELAIIKTECDQGLQYKILAGKKGAYDVLLEVLIKFKDNEDVVKENLKTITSLMTKQPDLLDEKGIEAMISFLAEQKDPQIQRLLLKWIRECCLMHEMNRQKIFNAGILDQLKLLLVDDVSPQILRDVLGVLRALILDDDVRVEFGKAHEHARIIATDTLCSITALLSRFKFDETVVNDLMITIASLLVRTEFCKKVEDAGGIEVAKDAMITFHDNDKLVRQCFKILKAMAGNDECKAHIVEKGCAPVIASALSQHKESAQTAVAGLAFISALTLKSPENSKKLYEAGIPEVIIQCMKLHPDDPNIQKNGSWAIRNMVCRSRYQSKQFLSLGAEGILKKDLKKFEMFEFDIKSALRDLGCQVEFKEEWTGRGGMLTTEANKND